MPRLRTYLIVGSTLLLGALFGTGEAAAATPGDLNGDDTSNVVDVQCGILVALWEAGGGGSGLPGCLTEGLPAADLNCDGSHDVLDIQALIRLALDLGFTVEHDHDKDDVHDACDPDDDNDGEPDESDCAPLDATRGLGGVEVCDGIDNDCDGTVDAGPTVCDDGNSCTVDLCLAASGCAWLPGVGACEDGDPCTFGDLCVQGLCVPGPAIVCNDGNPCTVEECAPPTGCVATPASGPCDDGDACTVGEACVAGACAGGAPLPCDDGDPCTTDSCSKVGGCTHAPATGGPCDDGDACTSLDLCVAGACEGQLPTPCGDGDPCTQDLCDPALGCSWAPADGVPCTDGDPCTGPDLCVQGLCTPGDPWCGGFGGAGCFADTDDQGCDGCGCGGCVCALDPYCCDVSWDPTCVARCTGECEATCDLAGSCCVARAEPFCSSATVTACVCNTMPECCNDAWGQACVEQGKACGSGCPN